MKELAVLLLFTKCTKSIITCRGLAGEAVDWYAVYKPPSTSNSTAFFYYADSNSKNWTLSSLPISNGKTAIGATLEEFYKYDQKVFVFAYNDHSPSGGVDSYRGHSKGVVVFDKQTGFWLIHSVPKFPKLGSYSYPVTGMKFGQMFLCLTLPLQFLGNVGEHLRYVQATPFSSNLPPFFAERFPVLVNIAKKQSLTKTDTVYTKISKLSTVGGMKLSIFAKHKKFNKDLWFDMVAPNLGTNLAVESWMNGGADDLESTCTDRISVYDVTSVTLPNVFFNSSKDHSKWAVSDTTGGKNMVCVGDLNRQKSQFRRGGGAVCFRHRGLWKILHSTVKSVQPCTNINILSCFSDIFTLALLILLPIILFDIN
ncbi:deoxyribonuclease II [Dictyocaulus viviparus]|uniref:Deoxyribonuclease II n=1 Tax=Dictyocaulus viviparus TaxID=29172 RepID=A0A0D8XRM7_DICVI|nr:deoxyribonuclease II [Dictyocaulus viviparus]